MRHHVLTFLLLLLLAAPEGGGEKADLNSCEALEVVQGQDAYNRFVCSGVALQGEGRFRESAEALEAALRIHLFEQPNYKPFMRLALVYSRAGMCKEAKLALRKAKLALSVLLGIAHCVEKAEGFKINLQFWSESFADVTDEISRRMCGAAYEGYYVRPDLHSFLRDAELIEYFFSVQKEVDGSR